MMKRVRRERVMAEVSKDWRMTPRQNREKPKTKPQSLREMERAERDARRKTERGNVSTQRRLTTTPVSEEPAEEAPNAVEEVVE